MGAGLENFDLLSVGATVAASVILGFVVLFNNLKSSTSRAFFAFSLVTAGWGMVNYLGYRISDPVYTIWLLRGIMFFAVLQAFALYRLFFVFPRERARFPDVIRRFVAPLVILTAILTLTPYVFKDVAEFNPQGGAARVNNGPGIILFSLVSVGLVAAGVYTLLRKMIRMEKVERRPIYWIWTGTLITFLCIILFNFVTPAFFNNPRFIPLGSLFFFPFIACTFYAIVRYGLMDVKVIATELLAFSLAMIALVEVVIADRLAVIIFRIGIFMLTLAFGILLIRSVIREVEQREKLEKLTKELEAANAKLQQLSNFKTQLLSIASHQIRSPLAAIKGFVSLLLDGSYGPVGDKVKDTLGKVKQSADNLIDLINMLLDLRRVEEGRMEYQFAKVGIKQLVADVFEALRPLAIQKGLQFTNKMPTEDIYVTADAPKMKQVIQNLIDNAIKYTPRGFVKVEVYPAKDTVMIAVNDSGLGIAPDLMPQMFEEFVRDARVKKLILGTGLGLYIARKIVEAHGGRIWAESKGLEKGSAFFVALKKVV